MATALDINARYFWYMGGGGEKYGPHSERQMLTWFRESFLASDVLIAEGDLFDGAGEFRPLADFMRERGVSNPFMPADCLPVGRAPSDTLSAVREIQEEFRKEMEKFRTETMKMMTTAVTKISLCAAKDGELLEKRLKEQIDAAKKACQEEITKAKQDIVTNFHLSTMGSALASGDPVQKTAPSADWMAEWRTALENVADLVLAAKIESEFSTQKIDQLQKTVDRISQRLQAQPAQSVDAEEYDPTLVCLAEYLRNIGNHAQAVIEGRVPATEFPSVMTKMQQFSKMLDGLREGLLQKPQKGDHYARTQHKLVDIYGDLSALQLNLLFLTCGETSARPERSVHQKAVKERSNAKDAQREVERKTADDGRNRIQQPPPKKISTPSCPRPPPCTKLPMAARSPPLASRKGFSERAFA